MSAANHVLFMLPEVHALGPGDPVPSPCMDVCRIDAASGHCDGCLRTIEEVAEWSSLRDEGKRAVWRVLEQRARALGEKP